MIKDEGRFTEALRRRSRRRDLLEALGVTLAIVLTIAMIVLSLTVLFPEHQYTAFRAVMSGVGGYFTAKLAVRLIRRR